MQTTLRIGLALLMGSCLPALAADTIRAEKPSFTNVKPGGYFEFTESSGSMGNCKRWTIKSTDSDGMFVIQCKDLLIYQSLANDFNIVKMERLNGDIQYEFKPYMPTLTFPLEVGKKWEGEYAGFTEDTGDKWKSRVKCETTAFEKVKVVAGEFDAFRIDCVDNWRAMLLFSGEKNSTRWYAPKLKAVIKVVHEDPKWNYQLTAYKLD
jgi:hypothetical protein